MGAVQACKTNQAWDQSLHSILLIHWLSLSLKSIWAKEMLMDLPKQ